MAIMFEAGPRGLGSTKGEIGAMKTSVMSGDMTAQEALDRLTQMQADVSLAPVNDRKALMAVIKKGIQSINLMTAVGAQQDETVADATWEEPSEVVVEEPVPDHHVYVNETLVISYGHVEIDRTEPEVLDVFPEPASVFAEELNAPEVTVFEEPITTYLENVLAVEAPEVVVQSSAGDWSEPVAVIEDAPSEPVAVIEGAAVPSEDDPAWVAAQDALRVIRVLLEEKKIGHKMASDRLEPTFDEIHDMPDSPRKQEALDAVQAMIDQYWRTMRAKELLTPAAPPKVVSIAPAVSGKTKLVLGDMDLGDIEESLASGKRGGKKSKASTPGIIECEGSQMRKVFVTQAEENVFPFQDHAAVIKWCQEWCDAISGTAIFGVLEPVIGERRGRLTVGHPDGSVLTIYTGPQLVQELNNPEWIKQRSRSTAHRYLGMNW